MKRGVSTYLDLIRIVAALTVFFNHFALIVCNKAEDFARYGHAAVILFFIISGYVIAYVSTVRETDIFSFAASRATRLYSVTVPALAVTAAIDILLIIKYSVPLPISYQLYQPWKYVPFYLAFGTDLWFLNETAFSNIPYWSLCYEAWYYVLFACWTYFSGRTRLVLCSAVLLLIGPRLWLLLPIWLSGVWLHRTNTERAWPNMTARVVWGITLGAGVLFIASGAYCSVSDALYDLIGQDVRLRLRFSQFFLDDYLLTIVLVIHLAALKSCNFEFDRWQRPIRYIAAMTFALYLFHYPLLELYRHWFAPAPVVMAVLISVWGLAIATDRLRRSLRRLLAPLITRYGSQVRIVAG